MALQASAPADPPLPGIARPGAAAPVVALDRVGLRYAEGPEVLRDVSLTLDKGGFYFITGASGAGKSSLLRLLYLGLRPTRGHASLFGQDVLTLGRRQIPALRRRIGVVFQDFRLLEHLTAFENVALPLRIAGRDDGQIRSKVVELLRWVQLGDRLHARPSTLSGGEQQRIAIARAVINRPHLLIADEPTGNVDEAIATRLLYLFEELNRLGTTVVIATHARGLVRRHRHPVFHLRGGLVLPLPPGQADPDDLVA